MKNVFISDKVLELYSNQLNHIVSSALREYP